MTLKPTSSQGSGGGGSGTVTQVSSADTSVAVATGTTTPVLTVAALNTIAANHATSGSVAMNSNKITGLANGSAASDAAAFGQIPAAPPKVYLNKPATGITVTSTTLAAFSSAWQITGVVVASGQNIKLQANIAFSAAANNDYLFAFFRDSTQIASRITNSAVGVQGDGLVISWIDENPGAATYTYEVRACQFTAGTITVYQTNITTNVDGGTSVFVAEVYTP